MLDFEFVLHPCRESYVQNVYIFVYILFLLWFCGGIM